MTKCKLSDPKPILLNHHCKRIRVLLGLNWVVCAAIRLWAPGTTLFAKVLYHLYFTGLQGLVLPGFSPGYCSSVLLTHTITQPLLVFTAQNLKPHLLQVHLRAGLCCTCAGSTVHKVCTITNTLPLGFHILARESMDPTTLGCYGCTSPMIIVLLCP